MIIGLLFCLLISLASTIIVFRYIKEIDFSIPILVVEIEGPTTSLFSITTVLPGREGSILSAGLGMEESSRYNN